MLRTIGDETCCLEIKGLADSFAGKLKLCCGPSSGGDCKKLTGQEIEDIIVADNNTGKRKCSSGDGILLSPRGSPSKDVCITLQGQGDDVAINFCTEPPGDVYCIKLTVE